MKIWLYLFLFVRFSPILAQQAPHNSFDVDSLAEPIGGSVYLNKFIQVNLRKPIQAEAEGIGGRIVLSGIVETNGHISNIKVVQSLRPDCDREAIRVFKLFNAWKPAVKDDKTVRQTVTVPITFKANEPFVFTNGLRIIYYDDTNEYSRDTTYSKRKQVVPLDTNSVPKGDIITYRKKGKEWKEDNRIMFVRRKNEDKTSLNRLAYRIGYEGVDGHWMGLVYGVDNVGRLVEVEQVLYLSGTIGKERSEYHENGLIIQKTEYIESKWITTSWYPNGQIKQIQSIDRPSLLTASDLPPVTVIGYSIKNSSPYSKPKLLTESKLQSKSPVFNATDSYRVASYWDSTGHQLVKDGYGYAMYSSLELSRVNKTIQTPFVEQGLYENHFKQGKWMGQCADKSYFYEEEYEKGVCKGGKAKTSGSDTMYYTMPVQKPEFIGGMPALGQFLGRNLRYPANAQRSGVQGNVLISFIMSEDGNIEECQVLKGVDSETDQEAIRVIKLMNGYWKSGILRGEKKKFKLTLPVNFLLE